VPDPRLNTLVPFAILATLSANNGTRVIKLILASSFTSGEGHLKQLRLNFLEIRRYKAVRLPIEMHINLNHKILPLYQDNLRTDSSSVCQTTSYKKNVVLYQFLGL